MIIHDHIWSYIIKCDHLREFVLTTIILTPGTCSTQGWSRQAWLHFRTIWTIRTMPTIRTIGTRIPGSAFELINTNVWTILDRKTVLILMFRSLQGRIPSKSLPETKIVFVGCCFSASGKDRGNKYLLTAFDGFLMRFLMMFVICCHFGIGKRRLRPIWNG